MRTSRLFAVDLGASGGKCFAGEFEGDSFRMREVHRFAHEGVVTYAADRTGRVTDRMFWDDLLLYGNIVEGLHKYRREVGERLDAIGIDVWGADGVFATEDGDMLGRVYCYRDHRLDGMIEAVKARVDARRLYAITGIHFQPFNLSNQLHWFVLNRRSLLRPGVFFLPVAALFYYYLGGVRAVDSSWASVTQLMDARTKQWSREILAKLEIPPDVLPAIVPPGQVLGEIWPALAQAVGINRAKLVAVGSHDTASAFAAAPVADPSESLIISSGTWSLVGKLIPEPITSDAAMAANISNEGGVGNVRLLKNCMGTWIVQELRRGWRLADGRELDWAEITALAEAAPAFGSFIDPDDPGFYNPANMEKAIEEFCRRTGQAVPGGRGACLRSVYESLALKYRLVNEQICAVSGTKTRVVNVVGGGSRNRLLNQFTADALAMPVLAGPEEATAVGNFMVQALGLGVIRSLPEALPLIRNAFPIREYRPENTAAWDKAFERFRKIAP
jgi:rhamnulokinase